MKLFFSLTASPSESAEASYGALCLEKDAAAQLLSLHAKVRGFLKENAGEGALCEHFTPSFGWRGDSFEAFAHNAEFEAALGEDEVCEAPGDMSQPGDAGEVRVECHRVEFGGDGVAFTALAKYGDAEYRTPSFPLELLRKIAG